MAFSSGTYSLPAGNPVVTATTISSTWANNTLNDIAAALSTCVLKDGTQTTTAAIPFAFGITIPTGKSATGAGTATLTGFKSLSVGSSGNLGAIAINGSTSGTANLTVDATVTKVTLDKAFDIGANALTAGAISGTTVAVASGSPTSTLLLDVLKSAGGAEVQGRIKNSANTASTRASMIVEVGGTSATGNALYLTSDGTNYWSWGMDVSASSVWKLANSANLGTSTILTASSTGLSVTGTLQVSSIGAFVASDKYLVVDSNGNIHKSATGPAS